MDFVYEFLHVTFPIDEGQNEEKMQSILAQIYFCYTKQEFLRYSSAEIAGAAIASTYRTGLEDDAVFADVRSSLRWQCLESMLTSNSINELPMKSLQG